MTTLYVSILIQGPDQCDKVLDAIKSQITLDSLGPPGDPVRWVTQADGIATSPRRASFSFFVELPGVPK